MKRSIKKTVALAVAATSLLTLAACGSKNEEQGAAADTAKTYEIAVPNDTTNEARALLLLQDQGLITLDPNAGITATVKDITDNPYNLTFKEVEAAQIPNVLRDVDFGIINSNYAIQAGFNPVEDSVAIEGSSSAYANVLCVKEGNEDNDLTKALVAAVESQQVADYITANYEGAVVSTVENPTDGYDASVDYAALAGTTVTVAASPTPHAEILAIAKDILAEKDITLEIKEFTDYVQPNNVVESGDVYANFFQHVPYLDDFNAQNGTHIVAVSSVHVEPMGIYGGKQTSLDVITAEK
ncbi:MAG: MetQ/NlpA family ABC transporter substrate-binding protein [Oscillospiraceae bacterium]|nr:MetQ/NlpA family ABC transporter substrate-binding protein [Oscillospiraceae bacterium]